MQVLSVVAQQLLTIQNALRANLDKFWFEGRPIKLQQTCGVFSECMHGHFVPSYMHEFQNPPYAVDHATACSCSPPPGMQLTMPNTSLASHYTMPPRLGLPL
jgi:hypothetical protein